MNKYERFLKKYFPSANISNKLEFEELHLLVCRNNFMTDIYIKYLDVNKLYLNQEKMIFLKRYKMQLNKLLIYIPLNDSIGINGCIRYCIEQLIKFLYAVYIDESVERINNTKYRILKDGLSKLENNVEVEKEILDKLFSYYGAYSNEIHDKRTDLRDELVYLKDLIVGENTYIKEVNKDIRNIITIYEDIMIRIFSIKENNLASFERMQLPNIVGKNRTRKLLELMEENS